MPDIKLLTGPKVDINQIRFWDDARVRPMNDAWVNVDLEGSLKQFRKMHLNAEFNAVGRRADIKAFERIKMLAPNDKVRDIKFPNVWLDVNKPIPHWRDLAMNHKPLTPNWFWPARCQSGRIVREVKVLKARECVGDNPFLKLKLPEDFKVGPDNMPRLKEPPVCLKGEPVKVDPVDALKGFWKAPRPVKDGLPANHPAMKGMHIGRRGDDVVNADFQLAMRHDMHFDFEGLNQPILSFKNDFHDVWNVWKGGIGIGQLHQEFDRPVNPKLIPNTAERAKIVRERQKRALHMTRSKHERDRLEAQKEDSDESYIRVCLKLMSEPGANWCQLIANMYSKVKTSGTNCKSKIKKGLTTLGFELLGRGHFSTAFKGPDGLVYKVNSNHNGSDAWFVYALNIKSGSLSGCVPKIGSVAYNDKTYCVTMELLHPLQMDDFYPYYGLADAIRNGEIGTVSGMMNITTSDAETLIDLVNMSKKQSGANCRFDIHYENMMYRTNADGNKQIVLTDPLAYGDFNMARVYNRLTDYRQDASHQRKAA